jgi:predicted GIY-YIG superfamily endonuclease
MVCSLPEKPHLATLWHESYARIDEAIAREKAFKKRRD